MTAVGLNSRWNPANLIRCLTVLLASLLLMACGAQTQERMAEKFSRPEDRARAQSYIDLLRTHDFAALEKVVAPDALEPNLRDNLPQLAGQLPSQPPQRITLVGAQRQEWSFKDAPPVAVVSTTFEYDYGDQWRLIQVIYKTVKGAPPAVIWWDIKALPKPLAELNRFTLVGKGLSQYAVLVGIVVAWSLTLVALILCIRTRMPRRKWLWLLFILLGFGQVSVDWTTGAWVANPLAFQVLSAGAMAAPFGPWIVSFSVPLGALIFLFYKRPHLRRSSAAAAEASAAPSASNTP